MLPNRTKSMFDLNKCKVSQDMGILCLEYFWQRVAILILYIGTIDVEPTCI